MNPGSPPSLERAQLRALQAAVERAGLTPEQLWLRYFALGGEAGPVEIEAYLQELMGLPPLQGDMLAQAVNEHLDELAWADRVPYIRTVRDPRTPIGPLAALVGLLDRSRMAPPERLPAIAAAAAEALGFELVIYLADEDQRRLVPLPLAGAAAAEGLAVDSSLAGRAYRAVEVVPVDANPPSAPRLYVPLLDGMERLGVLDVALPDTADPDDPALREECRWLSTTLGYLVTEATQRGDALEIARRAPRNPGAELIGSLLPPRTAGTDRVFLAGLIEYGAYSGGDAFDYAVSENCAAIALFGAAEHHPSAALITAAAIAAYRSARRDGCQLAEQASAIDHAVTTHFGGTTVTGFLGELDLITGRLSYVAAGVPAPHLLRDGTVLTTLAGGRRAPFGSSGAESALGDASLQSGDRLVLHTDGVTAAVDSAGSPLGEEGFRQILRVEAGTTRMPAEAARRLLHSVGSFRGGVLDEDATLFLVAWTAPTTQDREV